MEPDLLPQREHLGDRLPPRALRHGRVPGIAAAASARWTSVRPRRSRWRCRWRSASPPAVGPFPASQEQIRPGAGSLSGRVVLDHAHTLKLDVVAMPNEDTTALVVAAAVDAAGIARDGATVNGVPVVVDVNAAAVVRAVIVGNAGVVDVDGGVGAVDPAPRCTAVVLDLGTVLKGQARFLRKGHTSCLIPPSST